MSMFYVAVTTAVVAVASAGATIYSQQQAAEAQADAAEYNNRLAQQQAHNAELEAAEQIKRQRIADRKKHAALRNQLAGNGVLTTSGTPLAILGESSANFDLAIQDAARASSMQAAAMRAQGQMGLWESDVAKQAADLNSLATGLSAVGSAAGGYYRTKPSTGKGV